MADLGTPGVLGAVPGASDSQLLVRPLEPGTPGKRQLVGLLRFKMSLPLTILPLRRFRGSENVSTSTPNLHGLLRQDQRRVQTLEQGCEQ